MRTEYLLITLIDLSRNFQHNNIDPVIVKIERLEYQMQKSSSFIILNSRHRRRQWILNELKFMEVTSRYIMIRNDAFFLSERGQIHFSEKKRSAQIALHVAALIIILIRRRQKHNVTFRDTIRSAEREMICTFFRRSLITLSHGVNILL